MNHGGRREGAGRPTDYTLGERIAFAKMVIARQKKQPRISISKALQMLEDENQLIAGSAKALRRYLTPKYLPPNIWKMLNTYEHEGILSLNATPKTRLKPTT
jgi:hypothetical protein